MLTGKQLFSGDSVAETLASVMKENPSFDQLPEKTPASIRTLLSRCLERGLRQRLTHIGEARIVIEQVLAGETGEQTKAAPALVQPLWRRALPWSLTIVLAVIAALALWAPWRAVPSPPAVGRFTIALASGQLLAPGNGGLAVSPNGAYIAYSSTPSGGRRQLFLRPLDHSEAIAVPGTDNAGALFFSPDSQWIAFTADGKLKKVPVSGGTPITLADHPTWTTGTWTSDGSIFLGEYDAATTGKIVRVPAAGGTPQVVSTVDIKPGELGPRWLDVLLGGQAILYATGGTNGNFSDDATIVAQSIKTGERKVLVQGGTSPHYLSTGQLLYAQGGRLLAVPFDAQRLELTGAAVPILEDVWQGSGGYSAYDVSLDGSVAYINGGEAGGTQPSNLTWVDHSGLGRPIIDTAHKFQSPEISPDGRQVAVVNGDVTVTPDIWISETSRSTFARLSFGKTGDQAVGPVWTPDGKRVIYMVLSGTSYKLISRAADGSGAEDMLLSSNDTLYPTSCSPNGQFLVFNRRKGSGPRDLWVLELSGNTRRVRSSKAPSISFTPGFRPTATGWHTLRTNPAAWRSSCSPSPIWVANGRFPPREVRSLAGRVMAASCSIATVTR